MAERVRVFVADRGDQGERIDLVLRRHLNDMPAATRTRVQAWIEGGRVAVNGRTVHRVSDRAGLGDVLRVDLPEETVRAEVQPEAGPLEPLVEDEYLLVVNKPAGVVSHPTYRHPSGSLLNHLLWYARSWPEQTRPSLVGRLDKLTSGVVLVAKTTGAHARLQRTLASARSEKSYLAVVHGPVRQDSGTIDLPLQRDPRDRRRVVVAAQGGLPSITRFERLHEQTVDGAALALLRCEIVTGRMHQVRVHLAAEGWPIVGDPKYRPAMLVSTLGADHPAALFPRQALHAWRMSFIHPFTGAPVTVCAPVPADMDELIRASALIGDREFHDVTIWPIDDS